MRNSGLALNLSSGVTQFRAQRIPGSKCRLCYPWDGPISRLHMVATDSFRYFLSHHPVQWTREMISPWLECLIPEGDLELFKEMKRTRNGNYMWVNTYDIFFLYSNLFKRDSQREKHVSAKKTKIRMRYWGKIGIRLLRW